MTLALTWDDKTLEGGKTGGNEQRKITPISIQFQIFYLSSNTSVICHKTFKRPVCLAQSYHSMILCIHWTSAEMLITVLSHEGLVFIYIQVS